METSVYLWAPDDVIITKAKLWDEDLHPRDERGQFTDSDTGLTRSEANARQLFREHGWTPAKMQENLRGLIERARESGAYEEGLHWYQNAHDTAQGFADKYGVTIEQAAGVIAVLSPDTRWGRNVAEADRLLELVTSPTWTYTAEESDARYAFAIKMIADNFAKDMSPDKLEKALARAEELNMAGQALIGTHNTADLSAHDLAPYARIGTYYGNVEKAIEVARGDLSVIRGNKVEAFVDNILHPDTSDKVTIDTHMVRIIVNDLMIDDKVLASAIRTDARYNILAEQVTKVASELGVTPSQAQAIAWIQWSRVEHPDERNVLRRAATAAAKKKEIDEEEIFTDEQRLIFDLIWQGFTEPEIEELKEWDESQHLRDEAGRFTDTGGASEAHNYGVEDGYAFHEQNREWANGLTRDEQATITSYAGFGSIGINALMRGDREELIRHGIHVENPERMQQLVDEAKELQRLIDEGPILEEDTVVYRGISLPVGTDVGAMKTMDDPAFQSTMLGQEDRAIGYSVLDQGHHELYVGTDPRYNPQYPERVSVFARIIVPAGTHYVDVETVRRSERFMGTDYRGESELLFGPAHYTIDNVKLNAGTVEYAKAGVNWDGNHDIVVPYHEVTMTYHPLEPK